MKYLFSFFALLFFASYSMGQKSGEDIYENVYQFGKWEKEDKSAYVFADVCNVRAAADSKAEVVGKLTIATPVQILEISKVSFTQNGINAPWMKVKTTSLTGYVWGGLLTKGAIKLDDGNQVLWGITEIKMGEYRHFFASVRLANSGSIISKHDFQVMNAGNADKGYIELLGKPFLDNVDNVIVFNTVAEACGVYASMTYFIYAQGQLMYVGAGYSMGDGGVLHTSKSYEFPFAEETTNYHLMPTKNHVFCIENDGSYDDDCTWTETVKVKDYIWNEEGLQRFCDE